jgi:hypothetical protein
VLKSLWWPIVRSDALDVIVSGFFLTYRIVAQPENAIRGLNGFLDFGIRRLSAVHASI